MTRLGDVATFESVEAEVKGVDGVRVPVATPAALYLLKRDTVRPLDRSDAAALREAADRKMPVQKFRSVEEMNAAPILVVTERNGFESFVRHCGR